MRQVAIVVNIAFLLTLIVFAFYRELTLPLLAGEVIFVLGTPILSLIALGQMRYQQESQRPRLLGTAFTLNIVYLAALLLFWVGSVTVAVSGAPIDWRWGIGVIVVIGTVIPLVTIFTLCACATHFVKVKQGVA